jgi:PIN domain nuclease of toxin-antitoxin system
LILLLDTHVFLWQVLGDQRLQIRQKTILNDPANTVYLSAVSIIEMSIKAGIGELDLPSRYQKNLLFIYADFDFRPLPVTAAQANAAGFLEGPHRDPFDRLLAAQSIVEKMPIMTFDPEIKKLGAEVIW